MKILTKKQLSDIDNIIKLQGADGLWSRDSYMTGLYNGMELIRSIIYKDDIKFRELVKE